MSEVTAVPLRPIARGSIAKLWAGVGALAVIAGGVAWAGTGRVVTAAMTPAEFLAANAGETGVAATPSGLQYKALKRGDGPKPGATDVALVEYEGRLAVSGQVFDSSKANGGGPAPLPVAQMIPGVAEGLQLMPTGATYRFWIKPELGYGERDVPDPRTGKVAIPGNSVLEFDITLLAVVPGQPGLGLPGGR